MPFARFEDFNACTREMMSLGHASEDAQKICGEIKDRAEKGILYKAKGDGLQVLSKAEDPDIIVGGWASWDNIDDEGDQITVEAQAKALQRFFSQGSEWQSITVNHKEFKVAQPLLKYKASDGTEYFSHVNEKGTFLISKLRNDKLKTTQYYREEARKGNLNGYSITGLPLQTDPANSKKVLDIEYHSVTLTEKARMKPINPKSRDVKVLAKADGGDCDTFTCGAACCTFMTQHIDRADQDVIKYMELHGVETKLDGRGGLWLKLPVPCQALDKSSLQCTTWDNRPDICKIYPVTESPFIPREQCSLLRKRQAVMKAATVPKKLSITEILQKHGF